MKSMFDLSGKVAMVTGSGTGLGEAMALGLAKAGADVVGVYNSTLPKVGAKIEKLGRRFVPLRADLGSVDGLEKVVEDAASSLGRLDILVRNNFV